MRAAFTGIQIRIIWRLHRRGKYGGSHTSVEAAVGGFPSHLGKEAREGLWELVKQGVVILKPTGYGPQVSLNMKRPDVISPVCDWFAENAPKVDDRRVYEIEIA